MSEWKVILTPEFKQEFKDIYSYIAEVLLVPETAKNQVARILDQVEKLDDMPNRFPLFEKEPCFLLSKRTNARGCSISCILWWSQYR